MATSDFVLGGLASVGATFFTNPIEVIKTRIQLQGELAARGTYVVPYKSIVHAFVTVAKNDGILGLQKGLAPGLYFAFVINSFRLSIYSEAMERKWMHNRNGEVSYGLGLMWGAIGGVVGSYFSSPFFLIKTQLQSQAAKQIAVGYQHAHTSMSDALRQIYTKNGVRGLWRGSVAALPRAALGSGAQIATFGKTKALLVEYDLVTQPTLNSFSAGLIAGSIMSVAITPPDVISTRLYNQGVDAKGRGLLYRGWLDCFVKILRSEGVYVCCLSQVESVSDYSIVIKSGHYIDGYVGFCTGVAAMGACLFTMLSPIIVYSRFLLRQSLLPDQDATSGTGGQADRRWLSASACLDERCDKADIPEERRLRTLAGIHGQCEPGYGCFCRANRHFWPGQVSFEGKRLGYHPTALSFCSGLSAGSFVSVAITPLDVITTRLYNQEVDAQGRGLYYKAWLDCVLKILRSEGMYGLYKGFFPIYLRSAPYSTLVFLFTTDQ